MGAPAWAREAMVSTSSPLAVEAGLTMLRHGGSAVDAAIAADAVLGVVQPFWTGIGGDCFCLIDDGTEVVGFNGSGAAPGALSLADCQADRALRPIPAELAGFVDGLPDDSPLAVTVPGVVDAWGRLSERYGRLGLARVLEPAVALATSGYAVGPRAAKAWQSGAARLEEQSPLSAPPASGDRRTNPDLAISLEAIARGGPEAHYEGLWASAAVEVTARAGGVLGLSDLASHEGEWVEPLRGLYRGHEVLQLPPNGHGAAVLAGLRLLGRHDEPTLADVMSAAREAMVLAGRHVADPRHAVVPPFWAGDTVYTAAVAGGMTVSLISSVFHAFGSGLVAGGAVLQNRGCGFALSADHPNAVAGGKRPFHTIIPGLLRAGGRTEAAFGLVGGPMQPQGQMQLLWHLIDRGLDPQAALEAPRARWLGRDLVAVEAGVADEDADGLRQAGFRVLRGPLAPSEAGAGQVVRIEADGRLQGGSDPRRDGIASGW